MSLITTRKQQEQWYSSDEYDSDSDTDEYDSDSDDDVVRTKPTGKDAKTFAAFADAHRPDIKTAHPKMTTAEVNQDLIDLWYELTPSEIKLWAAEASKPNKAVDKDKEKAAKEKQKAKEKAAKEKQKAKDKAAKDKAKEKAAKEKQKAKKAKT
jgi:hypothetical protein